MADIRDPHRVSDQVTDAITQANVKVLGDSPAVAMANLFIATGQALANAAHAASAQLSQNWMTAQAASTQAVATLLAVDTASAGQATKSIYSS